MSSLGDMPDTTGGRRLNRALPGWAVDVIRDGVAGDHRRVWSVLVSIAMSAHLRGWTEGQYIREVSSRESRLWAQMRMRPDGRRPRSDLAAVRELQKAWEQGVVNVNDVGTRTISEIRDDAVELAFRWVDRLVDNTDDLSPTEKSVMDYVVSETNRRGMLRVTCPSRTVAEFAKVPRMTAHRTLSDLTRKGLLLKRSTGRPQNNHSPGRAAIYELADPETLPCGAVDGGTYTRGGFPMSQPEAWFRVCSFRPPLSASTAESAMRMQILRSWDCDSRECA
jgi:hypothetical protein